MRYVKSERMREKKDFAYRIYITDSLKAIGHLNMRYYDFIDDTNTPKNDRTEDEVIDHISDMLNKLGEEG